MSSITTSQPSRWPHRWAWALACATFPLVWWGGFVTATGSGMAFKDWLTSDGVFMPIYPWLSSTGDKFIEHGHRLLAMLAGGLTIALVISLYLGEPRQWVRRYGIALLVGVIAQGILGGMRVVLDERVLALIHGCVGPLFFGAAAGMIPVTSRRWLAEAMPAEGVAIENGSASKATPKLLRLAILTTALAYLQLCIGAVVRHSPLMLTEGAPRIFQIAVYFHLLLAAAVTFHVLLLAHKCFWGRVCRIPAGSLALLIGLQLLLGVSTWMMKYGFPQWAARYVGETGHFNQADGMASAVIVTAHGAVGSLIVALAVVVALRVGRQLGIHHPASRPSSLRVAGVLA
ncbi:COX15/CtaA family protein [Lacipirellula parvula]|uniref:Heme A synthase CtaA n=1 Tax=Lacipirellula parvula TaxID=2650471 RepID=A0A5K7XF58_9BACT|nr:COX15/CtaA family protein [Lacipirellula parvula]BBO35025.1 heme A synthase CtaA [Lacipirellula parvula]